MWWSCRVGSNNTHPPRVFHVKHPRGGNREAFHVKHQRGGPGTALHANHRAADLIIERSGLMGVEVPVDTAMALAALLVAMAAEPQNLSSVTDLDQAVSVHVVDSLSGLLVPEIATARGIVDIGSGGGFPGLVLAVALPEIPVTLVESERRKADWLVRASARFPNVRVVADRSETLARAERGAFPVATARALGPLPVVLESAAPLVEHGGAVVAWRGRRESDAVATADRAGAMVGLARLSDIDVTPIPGVSRHFSVWHKVGVTPETYPRRPGMAAKRPLA